MAGLSSTKLKKEFDQLRSGLRRELKARNPALEPGDAEFRKNLADRSLLDFIGLYLPHYLPRGKANRFHQDFAAFAATLGQAKGGAGLRLALAAPRGNGKTTLLKALVLQMVCYSQKRFILLISDSQEQAAETLEAIKLELEENPFLEADFPHQVGRGESWAIGQVVTRQGTKIKAYGTGSRIRGASHGVLRPDLILLDDLENDEQVQNLKGREKTFQWLWKSVLPLGPPDQSHDVVMTGTLLHYDSALSRLLQHPGFTAKKYQALERWPLRMDLWEEFQRRLWQAGQEAAMGYYEANQDAMQEGAQLLWPGVQSLPQLMQQWSQNQAAFSSEMQNEPLDEADRVFDQIHCYDQLPSGLLYFGAIDPSMGDKNRQGDPSALVVLGRSPEGIFYVAEAVIRRLTPDQAIELVIQLQRQWKCLRWAVETVQFQEFFHQELLKRAAVAGIALPAEGVKPHANKQLRIESMQPAVKNGLILLGRDQRQLLDQLRFFPKAEHDDGPDALQMAFALGQRCNQGLPRSIKPSNDRWPQYQTTPTWDSF